MALWLLSCILLLLSSSSDTCSVTKTLPSEASINVTFGTEVIVTCRIEGSCQHVHVKYNYTLINGTQGRGNLYQPINRICSTISTSSSTSQSVRDCAFLFKLADKNFNRTILWCQSVPTNESNATQISIQSHLDHVTRVLLTRKPSSLILSWKSPRNLLLGLNAAYDVILSVSGSTLFNRTMHNETSINLTSIDDLHVPTDPCVAVDCNITAVCGTVESSMSHDILYYPTGPPFNDTTVKIQKNDNGTVTVGLTLTKVNESLCNGNFPERCNLSVSYKYSAGVKVFSGLQPYSLNGKVVIDDIHLNGDEECNMSIVLFNGAGHFALPNKVFSTFDVQDVISSSNSTHFCLQCVFAPSSKADGCAMSIIIDNRKKSFKLTKRKGKYMSLKKCLLMSLNERHMITISVKDIDDGSISQYEALSRTFNFVISSGQDTPSVVQEKDYLGLALGLGISLSVVVIIATCIIAVILVSYFYWKQLSKSQDKKKEDFSAVKVEELVQQELEKNNGIRHRGSGISRKTDVKPEQLSDKSNKLANNEGVLVTISMSPHAVYVSQQQGASEIVNCEPTSTSYKSINNYSMSGPETSNEMPEDRGGTSEMIP